MIIVYVHYSTLSHSLHSVQGYGSFASFVQLRGSIPLFWSQANPLAPTPDFILEATRLSADVASGGFVKDSLSILL